MVLHNPENNSKFPAKSKNLYKQKQNNNSEPENKKSKSKIKNPNICAYKYEINHKMMNLWVITGLSATEWVHASHQRRFDRRFGYRAWQGGWDGDDWVVGFDRKMVEVTDGVLAGSREGEGGMKAGG